MRRFTKAWFVAHIDHFIISTVVSIAVSMVSNPVLHHMETILHLLRVPAQIIHWLGY